MKTKSLTIFLIALFVVEMNLGTEEDKNENKEDEKFGYEKIGEDVPATDVNFSLKMILIGNSMVGKSALSEKICKNTFPEGYSETVGFEFLTLNFKIVSGLWNNSVLRYQMWDACGNENYRSLITSFYNNANVVLLVYDITNVKSFEDIGSWVNDAKTNNTDMIIHFVLIGNKIDLEQERAVSKEEGGKFAEANGMKFVEVSAQTGAGIKDLENILAKIIYEEFKKYKKEKEEDKKKEKEGIIKKDDSEDDLIVYEKHTHSSSLCDCCKKICENC